MHLDSWLLLLYQKIKKKKSQSGQHQGGAVKSTELCQLKMTSLLGSCYAKGKCSWGQIISCWVETGGGNRKLKVAKGCYLCLKPRCVFQAMKCFVEKGKEGKSICIIEALTLKLLTPKYP